MNEKHWVNGKPIGASLACAVVTLYTLGVTDDWTEFAMVGRYNAMRHLKARGWIGDENELDRNRYCAEILADARRASRLGRHPNDGFERPVIRYPYRWKLSLAGLDVAEKLVTRGVTTRIPRP